MNTEPERLESSGEIKDTRKGWPLSRWFLLILLVFAVHVTLLFIFGMRQPVQSQPATNVPQLALVGERGEWLELNDPTLFALPNREGFAGPAWIEPPPLHVHMPDWTEKPRLLELSNNTAGSTLGTVFSRFMQTNQFAGFQFQLNLPPEFSVPIVPLQPAFASTSTMRVEGDLAVRPLLTSTNVPLWPYTNVIAPSMVQVLVSAAGSVISAVLLPPLNPDLDEVHDPDADHYALELARAARFAPAPGLTVGQLIFNWRTIVPAATNTPSGQ